MPVRRRRRVRHRLPRAAVQRRPGRQPGVRHRPRPAAATPRWSRPTRSTTATWSPGRWCCASRSRCWAATTRPTTSSTASGRSPTTAPACRSRWSARDGTPRDGSAPAVLYGYGSYEASMDPWFSIARLSLLDRGVVFAVAHIRGGGEMGRRWYDDGKLLAKKNTFTDFVACARAPGQGRLDGRRPAGRPGRLGRRPADGRGGQPRPGRVRRHRGAGAVRRRAQHRSSTRRCR